MLRTVIDALPSAALQGKIGPITHAWHIESAQEITDARSAFIRCKREKRRSGKDGK